MLLDWIKKSRHGIRVAEDMLKRGTEQTNFWMDELQREKDNIRKLITDLTEFKRWQKMEQLDDNQPYKG